MSKHKNRNQQKPQQTSGKRDKQSDLSQGQDRDQSRQPQSADEDGVVESDTTPRDAKGRFMRGE